MILAIIAHLLAGIDDVECVDVLANNYTLVTNDVVVDLASLDLEATFPPNVTVVHVNIQLTSEELSSGVILLRSASVAAASEATVIGDAQASSTISVHTPSVLKSANTTITVSYNCSDTFILLDQWTLVVNQTVVVFEFTKDCRLQGCISGCANGGVCNYLYGECECQPNYYGDDCGLYWKAPATVCPGSVMEMEYSVEDSPAANGDWWALYRSSFHDAVSDQIDFRYFWSQNMAIDNSWTHEKIAGTANYTLAPDLLPGSYVFVFYFEDGYTEIGRAYLAIANFADCGDGVLGQAAVIAPCTTCSMHGTCDVASGTCACAAGWAWFDCSRGCAASTTLTSLSGTLVSDAATPAGFPPAYVDGSNCTWIIEPPADQFDVLAFTVDRLQLTLGDVLYVEEFNTTDSTYDTLSEYQGGVTLNSSTFVVADSKLVRFRFVADTTGVSSGFVIRYTATKSPTTLTAGQVAGIVIGAIAVALVCGAVVFGAYIVVRRRRERRRLAHEEALNANAYLWRDDEEKKALGEHVASGSAYVVDVLPHDAVTIEHAGSKAGDMRLFARKDGGRVPVFVDITDTLRIVNHTDKQIAYRIELPSDAARFSISARPGVGVLAPRESRDVKMSLKLMFTCRVERWLRVSLTDGASGCALVKVGVEGEASSRLDPDLIELHGRPLGDGAAGVVYPGSYKNSEIAVKVLKKQALLTDDQLRAFQYEISVLEKLRTPFVVGFVGASHVPEFVPRGNVRKLLSQSPRDPGFTFSVRYKMIRDIATAMAFIHQNGIIHRDLKPENFLVTTLSAKAAVNCKMADFGSAILVDDPYALRVERQGAVGTPVYMPPELLTGGGPYTAAADIYSWAISGWQMLTLTDPFVDVTYWDLPRLVTSGTRPALPERWTLGLRQIFDDSWTQVRVVSLYLLISHCAQEQTQRPKATDLLERLTQVAAGDDRALKRMRNTSDADSETLHELRPHDDSTVSDQTAPAVNKMKKAMLRTTSTASANADRADYDEEKATTTSTSVTVDPGESDAKQRKKKTKK